MPESGSSLIRMNKYFKLWKPSVSLESNSEYYVRPYDLPSIVKEHLRTASAKEHFFKNRVDAYCAGYDHDLGRLKVFFHSKYQAMEWVDKASDAVDKSMNLHYKFQSFLLVCDE